MIKSIQTAMLAGALSVSVVGMLHAQSGATEGPGSAACANLVEAKGGNQANYREYALWISGFLTAANAYEQDTFDLTPWQPIEVSIAQIAAFCEANPQAAVAQAMAAYVNFLRPNRMTQPEELTRLRNGDTSVAVYPSVISQIRGKLIELELLTDAAPTEFGAEFGEALKSFQTDRGLPISGLPDARTLVALLN